MLKKHYLENGTIKQKEITFEAGIKTIKNYIEAAKQIKTVFTIPCYKCLELHQITIWDIENINIDMFNNNFIITDGKNSLSINKDANLLIQMNSYNTILFEDYNFNLTIID